MLDQQLLEAMTALLGRRDLTHQELQAWWAGTATGGPNGDGTYPATDSTGFVRMLPSPEKVRSTAASGVTMAENLAERDAIFAAEADALVYVNNHNGSADDAANGLYEYVGGAARRAEAYYRGLADIVRPLAERAETAAANAVANSERALVLEQSLSKLVQMTFGPATALGDRHGLFYSARVFRSLITQTGFVDEIEVFETEVAGEFAVGHFRPINGIWTLQDAATAQSLGRRQLVRLPLAKRISPRGGDAWGVFGNNLVGVRVGGQIGSREVNGGVPFPQTIDMGTAGDELEPQVKLIVNTYEQVVSGTAFEVLQNQVAQLMAGGGGGSGTSPFDYHVDGRPGDSTGNDANDGLTPETAFRTKKRMKQVLGSQTNKKIGFRRGSVWDHSDNGLNLDNVGISIGAYGPEDERRPLSLGAFPLTSFTSVGNGRYTFPLTYEPGTLTLVSEQGMADHWYDENTCRKLMWKGTAPAPIALGEWEWSNNLVTFVVEPDFDLTGWTMMIPVNYNGSNGAKEGIRLLGDNAVMQDVDWLFFADFGWSVEGQINAVVRRCEGSYSASDGADTNANDLMDVLECRFWRNGRRWGGGGGPGDGISCHINSNDPNSATRGRILGCSFGYNTQAGLGNQQGTSLVMMFNHLENNSVNINQYSTGADFGEWTVAYNLSIHSRPLKPGVWGAHASFLFGGQPGSVSKIHNNTMVDLPGVDREWTAVTFEGGGGELEWMNNILVARGFVALLQVAGSQVVSRGNLHFNALGKAVFIDGYRLLDSADDLIADPLFADPLNGDFRLLPASPGRGTGLPLGYEQDYARRRVSATPNRGAFQ